MAHLFFIDNKSVQPTPEVLLLYPFKEIWERDLSEFKEVANKEFAYIEFYTSAKSSNPFREYSPERKEKELKKTLFRDTEWEADNLVSDGIEFINKLQTEGSLSYRYWRSNVKAAEELINFFENFDISQVNFKSGNPLYKPRDITSSIAEAEKTLTTLNNIRKKVEEELFESTKSKGNKEISYFADPSNFNDDEEDDYE